MATRLVCVECGALNKRVYREYSKGNIRLSRCPECNQLVDKYVEFDGTLILIDMMLLKTSVYRHLLFNRLPRRTGSPRVLAELAIMLLVVGVFLKQYLYVASESQDSHWTDPSLLLQRLASTPNLVPNLALFALSTAMEGAVYLIGVLIVLSLTGTLARAPVNLLTVGFTLWATGEKDSGELLARAFLDSQLLREGEGADAGATGSLVSPASVDPSADEVLTKGPSGAASNGPSVSSSSTLRRRRVATAESETDLSVDSASGPGTTMAAASVPAPSTGASTPATTANATTTAGSGGEGSKDRGRRRHRRRNSSVSELIVEPPLWSVVASVTVAILASSTARLLVLLTLIWHYPAFVLHVVSSLVLAAHVVALHALLPVDLLVPIVAVIGGVLLQTAFRALLFALDLSFEVLLV